MYESESRWEDDESDKWFHGGGDYIFIDGATDPKVLKGIGGEDFYGESWGSANFSSPYAGSTMHRDGKISMYRFFLEAPIRFNESIRFGLGSLENENTSVGYWYQTEPHRRFFDLPPRDLRHPDSTIFPGAYDVELRPESRVPVAVVGPFSGDMKLSTPLDGVSSVDMLLSLSTNYVLERGDLIVVPPTFLARIGYAVQMVLFPFQPVLGALGQAGQAITGYEKITP